MEKVRVTIIHWKDYQPRKDVKQPSWFRLDHNMIESPQFFDFSAEEFKAWIYLLSQASQANDDSVVLFPDHAERVCKVKKRALESALKKLEELQIVHVHVTDTSRARDEDGTHSHATRQDKTIQDKTKQNTLAHSRKFDFESVYEKYPRKLGKSKGIAKAQREVVTLADFDALARAVDHFCEHHARERTELKYVPHFSTFMSSWRDWVDPLIPAAASIHPIKSPQALQLEREEAEFKAQYGKTLSELASAKG